MEKTTYYQLNKPEAADPLRVADFNENSDIIDAALAEVRTLAETERVIIGSYTGNGSGENTINLGFTPRFMLLMNQVNSGAGIGLVGTDFGFYLSSSGVSVTDSRVVSNGVYVASYTNNSKTYPNYYLAIL